MNKQVFKKAASISLCMGAAEGGLMSQPVLRINGGGKPVDQAPVDTINIPYTIAEFIYTYYPDVDIETVDRQYMTGEFIVNLENGETVIFLSSGEFDCVCSRQAVV